MAMVWGPRRVGKTALVRRFAEGRRAVFHTGAGRGQGTELTVLTRQVSGIGVTGIRDLPNLLRAFICARERVTNLPEDVIAMTAEDIFS